jgi:hypothetical protein
MKTITKIFALGILFFGFAANSFGQATASATAAATIVTPISILKVVDMNFGNVAVTATPGTVILTPAGSRSITGGVTLPVVVGTVAAASFPVSGLAGYTYAITLPASGLTITHTNNTNVMTVNAFTSSPTPTGTIGVGGTETLNVGATLNVLAGQLAGVYTSLIPFNVTVNYN